MRAASVYTEVVFHLLAFVPVDRGAPALARAASLWSPRYQAYAKAQLPRDAVEPCERDGALLGSLLSRPEVATTMQLLAILHQDVPQALRSALRNVGELRPGDVDSPGALAALRTLPAEPVEIARIAVALAAPEVESVYEAVIGPFVSATIAEMAPHLAACAAAIPALGTADIRLSATLGPHGRGYGDTVIVGSEALPTDAPEPWGPITLAVHELSVQAASRALQVTGIDPTWARAERVALLASERALKGTPLEPHYARWRATLSTEGLVPDADVPDDAVRQAEAQLSGASA